MHKSVFRSTWPYALLAGGFILGDMVIDHLLGDSSKLIWPHLPLAAGVVLISVLLLNRAMAAREAAEAVLRQTRDELEIRVRERTTELERINQALQAEIADRKQAELARERMEQALRASEEKYRLLFHNMAEGFALYELLHDEQGRPIDWRVLEVNDAYTHHTGITRDRIVGQRISELFPAAIPEYLPHFAQVVATQTSSTVETYARAVGRYQRVVTFPAGGFRFANTIEDITDRRRVEEALRASEDKFATVFRLSPDAIAIMRIADGTFLDINEAFTRLLGYARSEVIGRSWADLSLTPATDEQDKITELVQMSDRVSDHELRLTTREGNIATVLISLVSITINGELCILVIAHDITKRKRSEDALRRAQVELARGVQERTTLEERQRLARELHDSVSQALYGISLGAHTALTLFDTDRPRVLEALNYVISLAQAGLAEMRALIFELRPESLEMEGLVSALTKHAMALRAHYGIEVEVKLGDEPDVPFVVKQTLYRIAQEALQNAVKHARPHRLEVTLTRVPDSLWLMVCDDGIGFDPLAAYPGHLGLCSMRERAASVDGTLEIVSQPNHGTQIRVYVPIRGDTS